MPLLHYYEEYEPNLRQFQPGEPRNHVICIDGTGNDSPIGDDDTSTNVFRIYDAVSNAENQVKRYYPGVGSEEYEDNKIMRLAGKVSGAGARRIVRTAYLDLVKSYRPGDRLYLFGFSRGAAMIRMLANRVTTYGIPERVVAKYYRQVFRDPLLMDIKCDGDPHEVDVKFMGVFDTVASFAVAGNINLYEKLFMDFHVAPDIDKVFHLMSIDEDRTAFEPTLMEPEPRIDEIWFPGVHSDSGGGYKHHNLSDCTLRYMVNRAMEHGLRFAPLQDVDPNSSGPLHDHRRSKMPKASRTIKVLGDTRFPKVHVSAFAEKMRFMRADGKAPKLHMGKHESVPLEALGGKFEKDERH